MSMDLASLSSVRKRLSIWTVSHLSGKKMKGYRAVKNKFERENFSVELLSPPYSSEDDE